MHADDLHKIISDSSFDWEVWEDQDGQPRLVSPSCERISGYAPAAFIDYPGKFESIILDEDLDIWKSQHRGGDGKGTICEKQFRIHHRAGHVVWLSYQRRAALDVEGRLVGYRSRIRDITEDKTKEESSFINEGELLRIIETLPFSLTIATLEGIMLYVNPKGMEYFEAKEDIIGQSAAHVHWVDPKKRDVWYERIFKEGTVTDFEMHLKTETGKELWAIGSGIIIEYKNQTCILATQHDITQRKEIEQRNKESEEQYKLLFEYGAEAVVVIRDGHVVLSNALATNLTGYTQEELGSLHFVSFIYPEDAPLVVGNHIKRLQGEPVDRIYSYRILRKDGVMRWVEMNSTLITWKGKPATFNLLSDITERKKADDALRISEEKYRLLFEHAVEAILVIQNAQIKICNPMTTALTGYSHEELTNMTFTDFVHPEDKEKALEFHQKRLLGETQGSKQQFRIIRKDKQIRWIESDGIPIRWSGNVASLQFAMDITDRKSTEEKILYLSYFDQMTGLYNRRFYEVERERLDTQRNFPLTLVLADVNELKMTNDAFGHRWGDLLLKTVADIIKMELRQDDILARIGGDEFVLLLPKTDEPAALAIIKRLREKINQTVIADKIFASVSFGFAAKTSEDEDIEKIFSLAEDDMYKRKLRESKSVKSQMMSLIIKSLFEKCPLEEAHCRRVEEYCKKTAIALGFDSQQTEEMALMGRLHDIGKIGLDANILNSREKLSDKEWSEIKKHPQTGYHILKSLSEYANIAEFVLCHHERPDGKGYPRGIGATDIPLASKILAVCDAYDWMTQDHYQEAVSKPEAVKELMKNSGSQFDEEVVKIFIEKVI